MLEGSSTSGKRTLHCKVWSGNRKGQVELILSSDDLGLPAKSAPETTWHAARSAPKPPTFPTTPVTPPCISISKLDEMRTMQPPPQPTPPTLLGNFSSVDEMLDAALKRGFWLHDELPLVGLGQDGVLW